MRVLIPFTYCDICNGERGERVDALEDLSIRMVIGNKPMRVDCCTEHKDPTWSQISEHAIPDLENGKSSTWSTAKRARNAPSEVAKQQARSGQNACDQCERTFDTVQGMTMHKVRAHGHRKK